MDDEKKLMEVIGGDLEKLVANINPEVLATIGNEESPSHRLEGLKFKIDAAIVSQLMGLANAVHYGKMKKGEISSFMEAIMRVGTTFVKSFVVFRTIFNLHDKTSDMEILGAKSFATAALAKLFAVTACQCRNIQERAELGGLFSNIGRAALTSFWHRHGAPFNAKFVEKNSPFFTERIIEKTGLPEYLKEIANAEEISWNNDDRPTPAGFVALARAAVERSFAAHNALVVESAMPDAEDVNSPVSTVGSRLEEDFRAIGMGKYIRIVPPSTPAVRFTTDG
ncbi:MAG: HDOD domain-containing protein [Patescibacteria group bacterium]